MMCYAMCSAVTRLKLACETFATGIGCGFCIMSHIKCSATIAIETSLKTINRKCMAIISSDNNSRLK